MHILVHIYVLYAMLNNSFIHLGKISRSIVRGYQLVTYNSTGKRALPQQEKHKLSSANLIYISLKKANGRNTISVTVSQDKPAENNIISVSSSGADEIYISFDGPGWGPTEVQTLSPPCAPAPAVPRAHKFLDPPLLPPVDETRCPNLHCPWSSTTSAFTPFSTAPSLTPP
jgi:hypothetical protein